MLTAIVTGNEKGRAVLSVKRAKDNPFNSVSLEWQVPSPPPHENFEEIPHVTDYPYVYGKKKTEEH